MALLSHYLAPGMLIAMLCCTCILGIAAQYHSRDGILLRAHCKGWAALTGKFGEEVSASCTAWSNFPPVALLGI